MKIKSPRVILGVLSGLNLVNYLDRNLVAAVGPKLESDLGLSDFQFGGVINAFMPRPCARNRRSRVSLISGTLGA